MKALNIVGRYFVHLSRKIVKIAIQILSLVQISQDPAKDIQRYSNKTTYKKVVAILAIFHILRIRFCTSIY